MFGPYWAQKFKKSKMFYLSCDHLAKSYPAIYDTTKLEDNPFLPAFGPIWAIFGTKNENLE